MPLHVITKFGAALLAACAGSALLPPQQQTPAASPHAPGQSYTVPVRPCGEFGKPPCGTVVTIPAGATGPSLFALAKQAAGAGRNWEAIIYVAQAAPLGYVPAEAALGTDFAAGSGVPQDWVKARYWLKKAADQGDGACQAAMGEMYERGQGGAPDQAAAVRYYTMAAAQHVARGEARLGIDYELGSGVAHDRQKAISLLRRAAAEPASMKWAATYATALSRAGTRRFRSQGELDAYVDPPQKPRTQTQQASSVPARCPAELNFAVTAYYSRAQFCSRHPGCPYQTNGMEQVCQRLPNGYGVN